MTLRVVLPVLMAGAAAVPAGVPAVAEQVRPSSTGPAIRSITLNPAAPVAGPTGSVHLVIEVVARGVASPAGMTVQVDPGPPPGSAKVAGPGGGPGPVSGPLSGHGPLSGPGPAPQSGQVPVPPVTVSTVPSQTARHALGEWEIWRFEPDKKLSRWYPAGPWTVAVTARGTDGGTVTRYAGFQLRRDTKFSSVQAVRKGAGVEVRGVLNRVDPQGYLDYAPFSGQTVEILHREPGQERWTRSAEATTDLQGHFLQTVAGHRDDEWRARFVETGHYAAGRSRVHRAEQR
ncbi:hypothetical protein [Streptosporangium sp. NBC_01756]|uniref:hypothetical protein n=1 Tax=Streptosporangium sp. NBC_01756 TaxID=2975950 RepID=UPI002DDA72CA|nr:hypothetical protein [Streptosporangium sp. NBC_01756]WSC87097.1 hypothetical protein OIE48_02415 [Streptosporangium sp. NBC_01756]